MRYFFIHGPFDEAFDEASKEFHARWDNKRRGWVIPLAKLDGQRLIEVIDAHFAEFRMVDVIDADS